MFSRAKVKVVLSEETGWVCIKVEFGRAGFLTVASPIIINQLRHVEGGFCRR